MIFDVDGLLLDSERLWEQAEAALLDRRRLTYTDQDRAATLGRSIDDSVRAYGARMGLLEAELPILRRELITLIERGYAGVGAQRGVRRLINALRGRIPMGVASNADRRLIESGLRNVGIWDAFSAVVTAEDVAFGKPAPDVYLLACRQLGIMPSEALAFEDSAPGVASAKAAGLTCVMVPSALGAPASGADRVVVSLREIVVSPPKG